MSDQRNRNGFSLAFLLFLALTLAIIGVGFASGLIAARMERQRLYEELARHNASVLSMLRASLMEPLLSEDIPVIRTVIEQVAKAEPELCEILVTNEEGKELAAWRDPGLARSEALIRFSDDVVFEGERFGKISIAWTADHIATLTQDRRVHVWVATAIPLTVLLVLVLLIVHWLAVRPLKRIYRRIHRLAQGDLQQTLQPRGSRELRLLADTVNRTVRLIREHKSHQEELKRAYENAYEAKEMAEVTLHSIGDAVITTDRYGRVTYLNPVAEKLTGWSQSDAIGRFIGEVFFIVDGDTGERITDDPVVRALETGEVVLLEGYAKLNARDGQQYVIEDSAAPIRARDGHVLGAVLVFHDVTEQRRMAEEINYQATHDPLTGLFNRRAFEIKLQQLIEDIEAGEHALLYLDLDQFKVVNDTCGHAAGDALLNQLSGLMRAKLRSGDILARLGGDEFAVILPHCPLEQALSCAEKLRQSIQEFRFVWQGNTFAVGVSIGLVPFQSGRQSLEEILSAADQACFAAKDSGRNRVHMYQPDDRELARRRQEMHWVARIHRALERHAFELYAQAIVSIAESRRKLTHYEILLRMYTEEGELVPPGAFLPAAERYDLMGLIDRWVVEQYFAWLAGNPEHLAQLRLAGINISGVSVSDRHFLDFVTQQFEKTGIPPHKICFEITETVAIANLNNAKQMIKSLKDLGCRFALDDFGTGMSSFGYLKHMEVDFLKIDGGFVKDIVRDPIDRALVKAINEVGHIMGKQTIAEFVEDDEILSLLAEIGVDYAQGYGVAKPRRLQDLVAACHEAAYNPSQSVL